MSESTTNNSEPWRVQLTRLLEDQRDTVNRLNDLAQQQADHIREGRSDALLNLLGRRQQLIDGFLATHNAMQSLTEDLHRSLDGLSGEERESIRAMIDEINSLLSKVLERDEQDRQLLEEARRSVRKELASVTSGQQARDAYLRRDEPGSPRNRFADQRG